MIGLIVLAFVVVIVFIKRQNEGSSAPTSTTPPATASSPITTGAPPAASTSPQLLTMEVNKAVMVTVELDFGPQLPTIAQALTEIERRYQPADGLGRTFAILDAYGEPTANGKLHMSMHVSSEKSGAGSLVFKRTGEVLWNSRITPVPNAPTAKNLGISVGDEQGGSWVIDGSNNPSSILDARVRDKGVVVRDFWPDGAEREVTFVYSACGCPVKAMVRRVGERTARTKDLPVMFPDDPAAVQTISQLMRW